jgi:hypothetical protein
MLIYKLNWLIGLLENETIYLPVQYYNAIDFISINKIEHSKFYCEDYFSPVLDAKRQILTDSSGSIEDLKSAIGVIKFCLKVVESINVDTLEMINEGEREFVSEWNLEECLQSIF